MTRSGLSEREIAALVSVASRARCAAHAPYSRFQVGAALVDTEDRVFVGCNVENASLGLSLCAERAAIAAAVAGGMQRLRAIVIVTEADPPATPCGACRQWLREFGDDEVEVICAAETGARRRFRLRDLLPDAFALPRDNGADVR
jgi:cytidine deaminase